MDKNKKKMVKTVCNEPPGIFSNINGYKVLTRPYEDNVYRFEKAKFERRKYSQSHSWYKPRKVKLKISKASSVYDNIAKFTIR